MKTISILLTTLLIGACSAPSPEVNLYSARKEALIKPLLDAFTEESGIKVNIISGKDDALLERIKSESTNSPADLLLTTDAGRLHRAKQAGLFAPVQSDTLEQSIPENYRDGDNLWFGLSVRARPIMVSTTLPNLSLSRYEDLTNPALKGQICIRSSDNIYNQSLVASMLAVNSADEVESWISGLVANFARAPQGGDRDQIRAAAAGQCSVVVANTYYLANMLADQSNPSEYEAATAMRVIWPNQNDRGAHVNVSGAGLIKTAPNSDNAIKLLEFLASDKAQQMYADVNFEYPVKTGIELNSTLASWGSFKADSLTLDTLGKNNAEAVKVMDRAGWK